MMLTSRYLGVLNTIANCEGNNDKCVCHGQWFLATACTFVLFLWELVHYQGVKNSLRKAAATTNFHFSFQLYL